MLADNLVTMPWFLANSAEMRALKGGFITDDFLGKSSHWVVWVMEAEGKLVVEAVAVGALRMTAIAMGKMM